MTETFYTFVRGKGWVPECYGGLTRIMYGNKNYRVTILNESPADYGNRTGAKNCRYVYDRYNAKYGEHLFKSLVWWEEWADMPAGYGSGTTCNEWNNTGFVVITEEL